MVADDKVVDGSAWERLRGRQQLAVLTVLLAIYCALPIVMSIDFIVQIFFGVASRNGHPAIDTNALVEFANPLASSEGSVLEALHKLILPLGALFLGANFDMLKNSRFALWLFVLPLVAVICALAAASLLDAFQTSEVRTQYPGLSTLFRDIASNLGIVLMLLIGQNIRR